MSSERHCWQIVVSPPGGGDSIRFSLSVAAVRILAASAVLVTAVLVTGVAIYSRVLREAGRTKQLAAEVRQLRSDNEKIVALARDIDEIRAREKQVLDLLGVSNEVAFGRGARDTSVTLTERPAPAAASLDDRIPSLWPVIGEVSRMFTLGPTRGHQGVDIAVRSGTPVQAAGAGVVAYAGADSVFGNLVRIDHGTGYSTLYGHNSRLAVVTGQTVMLGQIISYVGNTGISSAPHLHFEVRRNGQSLDPLALIGSADSRGMRHR